MTAPCWECGLAAEHDHHVVPKSRGGRRTIPLCGSCHGKVHDVQSLVTTSSLTRAAMARKRKAGEYTGGRARYGYTVSADGCALERNEPEQAVVAAAIRHRAAGLSLRAVGDALAARGLMPRTGKRWHAETVKAVLAAAENDE